LGENKETLGENIASLPGKPLTLCLANDPDRGETSSASYTKKLC